MGKTSAEWRDTQHLTFYDATTQERTAPFYPVVFYDDFLSSSLVIPAAGAAESGMPWTKKIVAAAGAAAVAGIGDAAGGVIQCELDNTVETQDAALYFNDERNFDLTKGCVFEARVKVNVIPTLTSETVVGLVGDYAAGPDNITYSCFFTHDGSGEAFCEMDDNATDRSATSGVTVLNTAWHIYRIDATNVADVKYYIDGVGVATGTTFSYAATGANAILQPYIGLYKNGGAGLGELQVDYVRIWQTR